MPQITITEALSEINLIKKKITSKETKIREALFNVSHLPDPFEKVGGSKVMIINELVSLSDLGVRLRLLRNKISRANLENSITLTFGDKKKTLPIHDWLIWKRELAKGEITFISSITRGIKTHLDQISKAPQVYKDDKDVVQIVKTNVNIDYPGMLEYESELNDMLQNLDGQLSLKNATILLDV